MLLKNLIRNSPRDLRKLDIKGLAINSKDVKKGFIFFAIKGNNFNGEKYIDQAIKKGAILIFCSSSIKSKNKKVKIFKTNQVKSYLSEITSKFYKIKPKNIFAVTGTNGKTSVADYFYQILTINKKRAASIGTLGIKYSKKKIIKTKLTSPDIITLHKNLAELKKRNIDHVIIEASSHGLDQGRLDCLNFKAGIFTNFSQDHLDYHKTMKSYLKAKLNLFSKLLPNRSFIISDKELKEYSQLKKISKKRNLNFLDINDEINQIKSKSLPLIGSFQIKNLSMSVIAAKLCNLKKDEIYKHLNKIKNVNGRLDLIKKFPNNVRVFVDYAHTPDALLAALSSLKEIYNKNISLVFGCGGERDFKKRPLMAKVAKKYSKKIYITDDNPRNENPSKIRKQITNHLKGANYFNIADRSLAIKKAIFNSEPNEIILIAGKGHENYQDYGKKIIKISDKTIVNKIKVKKNKIKIKDQNFLLNSKILKKILKNKKSFRFNDITIDSRKVKKDNLFLAIKGKINDGSKFISKAFKNGASVAVTSSSIRLRRSKIIKVKDPLIFLNEFAKIKRDNCNAKIIAITGSAGKTSLKDTVNKILNKYNTSYASPKSYNNHYGVPISLSNLKTNHHFGIFEVGMSKAGEINKLTKLLKPNIGIITNIAEAHIENFKNIKGIAKAKAEIIDNIQPFGKIILNRDDKFFDYLSNKAKLNKIEVVSFGKLKDSDVKLIKHKKNKKIDKITVKAVNQILEINLNGVNIYNVLATLALLKVLGLDPSNVKTEFIKLNPSSGRGKIHNIRRYNKNFSLIDESYNANPLSVKTALNNFSNIKKDKFKKYLLLGDMLELGKKSKTHHINLSKLINSSDIDKVFIKGKNSFFTYKYLNKKKRGNIIQCNEDVDLVLKNIIANNDYLMIKGSNATDLNIISNKMIRGLNAF